VRQLSTCCCSGSSLVDGPKLCRYYGAHVIGTTSSESKVALARAHGAEHVFLTSNTSAENIEAVHRLTGNGVHVVYDGIGEATWEEDFQIVRPKGTIVSFGNASGPVLPFAPLKLSPKALKVTRPTLGPFIAEPEDFARYATEIFDLVKKGAIKVGWALQTRLFQC
jgi:NADPH2:quinone reductase